MRIGIPKEVKQKEFRVSLLPKNVLTLTKQGHEVYLEEGAGIGSDFSDDDYKQAGAIILKEAKEVFETCEMIIKVKEPQKSEYELLQNKQILFTYLHLAPLKELTQVLLNKKIIAIAYETIEKDFKLPLLRPMSEIAGEMAPLMGAFYLSKPQGSMGILICGSSTVAPAKILIIGNGVVARASEKIALGLGADVHIIARNPASIDEIILNQENLENEIAKANIIIGGVLIKGAKAPSIITKQMLKLMQKGSLLIDVAIDQGGCFETSRPTTHDNPTYSVDGILHYCVANMPGAYPKTASIALSNESISYVQDLANKGWKQAVKEDESLRLGVNVCLGHVTYKAVALSHQLEYTDILDLI